MTQKLITHPILVLVGPTAIGKTALSLALADRHNCEIISVDSMQVYRLLDVGTAKASAEERAAVVHHLIDVVDPDEDYDAGRFAEDAFAAINTIINKGKIPLLTGGTGLYLRAVLEGISTEIVGDIKIRNSLKKRLENEGSSKLHEELYLCDQFSARRIHINDTQRLLRALEVFYVTGVPWSQHLESHRNRPRPIYFQNVLKLGLTSPREKLYERINRRCDEMLENGLEAEVKMLLAMGYSRELKCFGAIGYRHMLNYLSGEWTEEEMSRLLARDTRRYAKRQYTWFSKIIDLHWFEVSEEERILSTVEQWLLQQHLIEQK
ncbi:MAG: tRNA (adenosine(37)-N6)-dimethylallyltransferase MiaA [Desulforhopalus sp.]